jgi:hypothetical protein
LNLWSSPGHWGDKNVEIVFDNFTVDRGTLVRPNRRAVIYIGGIESQSGCDVPTGRRLSDEGPRWLHGTEPGGIAGLANVDPQPYYFSYGGTWRNCTTGQDYAPDDPLRGAVGGNQDMAVYTRGETCQHMPDEAIRLRDQITRIRCRSPR